MYTGLVQSLLNIMLQSYKLQNVLRVINDTYEKIYDFEFVEACKTEDQWNGVSPKSIELDANITFKFTNTYI